MLKMKILVFGGTGYIGRHIVTHLVGQGHQVAVHIRRAEAEAQIRDLGGEPILGSLDRLDEVLPLLADYDGIIWAAQLMLDEEHKVISAFVDALKDTGKALIFTSGSSLLTIRTDGDWDENSFGENDTFVPRSHIKPRLDIENMVRDSHARGVKGMVIRPPVVWGNGGSVIISDFYHSAEETGAVCYIGRGLNVYSNVHVEDLANLYALALSKGEAGALYHAVSGEQNFKTMCETIATHLNLPTRSVTVAEGVEIWDKFMAAIVLSSNSRTRAPVAREALGWRPSPDKLDILTDCVHPAYADQLPRALPAWVRSK